MKKNDLHLHALLVFGAALTLYPIIFTAITSLKNAEQFAHNFWGVCAPLHWENYAQAWQVVSTYILNSAMVSVLSVTGVVVVSTLSAYAFARHRFPGSGLLFGSIIALMMVPGALTLISSFMWMKQFPLVGGNDWLGHGGRGLLNSHAALVLPYVAGGQVFAIFVLRSFIAGLPEDIFEAARIDGATELHVLRHIVLPLSKPMIGTIAIMNLLAIWNDYVWPLIVISDDSRRTLTIGLAFLTGANSTNYGPLMAGYMIASLPLLILFLMMMRHFVSGLTSGALKA